LFIPQILVGEVRVSEQNSFALSNHVTFNKRCRRFNEYSTMTWIKLSVAIGGVFNPRNILTVELSETLQVQVRANRRD
jgi:hypothetical protein